MSVSVAGRPVSFVSDAVALIGDPVTVISGPLALGNGALALIGGMVALIGDAVAVVSRDLGLVKGRPAAGQVTLGGLQGLLGGVGAGLGLPHPDIVVGSSSYALALGVLDNLLVRNESRHRKAAIAAATGRGVCIWSRWVAPTMSASWQAGNQA
jgi:hypothetical protein